MADANNRRAPHRQITLLGVPSAGPRASIATLSPRLRPWPPHQSRGNTALFRLTKAFLERFSREFKCQQEGLPKECAQNNRR